MTIKVPFILKTDSDGKPSTITVFLDGKPQIISSTAPLFDGVFKALKAGDIDGLRRCLEVKKSLSESKDGKFKLFEDALFYDGVKLGEKMFNRIMAVYRSGLDITPIVNFLGNLHANPSQTSRDELYLFLEHNSLPITEDGHFLAYKVVTGDYKDCHTRTMDNSVGATVSMPRQAVNENRYETCSTGLHFCSHDYIKSFRTNGTRLMVLKINPADVVSIPADYNNSKGRACKYLVLEEIGFNGFIPDDFVEDEDDGEDYDHLYCPDCWQEECVCGYAEDGEEVPESTDKDALLSIEDVRNIRKALGAGILSLTAIGKMFNRHRTQIQRIRDGQSYANVK